MSHNVLSLLNQHYSHGIPHKVRILDLGCGNGCLTHLVTDGLGAMGIVSNTVGCDLSWTALRKAKNSCGSKVAFVQADAGRLSFRDDTFDGAISVGYGSVTSYFDTRIQEKLFRVIQPGGWLIVDFRNHLSLWFVLFKPLWIIKWVKRFLGFEKPSYHFSTFGVRRYFRHQGFEMHPIRFLLCFPPSPSLSPKGLLVVERLFNGRLFARIFFVLFLLRHEKEED